MKKKNTLIPTVIRTTEQVFLITTLDGYNILANYEHLEHLHAAFEITDIKKKVKGRFLSLSMSVINSIISDYPEKTT